MWGRGRLGQPWGALLQWRTKIHKNGKNHAESNWRDPYLRECRMDTRRQPWFRRTEHAGDGCLVVQNSSRGMLLITFMFGSFGFSRCFWYPSLCPMASLYWEHSTSEQLIKRSMFSSGLNEPTKDGDFRRDLHESWNYQHSPCTILSSLCEESVRKHENNSKRDSTLPGRKEGLKATGCNMSLRALDAHENLTNMTWHTHTDAV